jgi:hypothetical protein
MQVIGAAFTMARFGIQKLEYELLKMLEGVIIWAWELKYELTNNQCSFQYLQQFIFPNPKHGHPKSHTNNLHLKKKSRQNRTVLSKVIEF